MQSKEGCADDFSPKIIQQTQTRDFSVEKKNTMRLETSTLAIQLI